MSGKIGAIETHWMGYRFRSRLEARWAVYFDHVGIEFEYEPQGYHLGRLGPYLPDFWLPQVKLWAEVKPVAFTRLEFRKCRRLFVVTGNEVLILVGQPDDKMYQSISRANVYYSVTDFKDYHRAESRFWVECDGERSLSERGLLTPRAAEGILLARSARFEHGEAPRRARDRSVPYSQTNNYYVIIDDLLRECAGLGVNLRADGDRLRVDAPAGAVTTDLRDRLRTHKLKVLAALRREARVHVADMLQEYEAGGVEFRVTPTGLQIRDRQCWLTAERRALIRTWEPALIDYLQFVRLPPPPRGL